MRGLDKFLSFAGPGKAYKKPSEAALEKAAGRIPDSLLEEWRTHGWCSYADGAFWTVDPAAYVDVLREWFPEWVDSKKDAFVFGRTAFGDLVIYRAETKRVGELRVHYGLYDGMMKGIDLYFNLTLDEEYLEVGLKGDLAQEAKTRYGAIRHNQMYTFEPALALGGERSIENVRKVALFPQLSFLRQLYDSIHVNDPE